MPKQSERVNSVVSAKAPFLCFPLVHSGDLEGPLRVDSGSRAVELGARLIAVAGASDGRPDMQSTAQQSSALDRGSLSRADRRRRGLTESLSAEIDGREADLQTATQPHSRLTALRNALISRGDLKWWTLFVAAASATSWR